MSKPEEIEIKSEKALYTWTAFYTDKDFIQEFDKDGTQHLFREIDLEKLIIFSITDGKRLFYVNVKTGIFFINGLEITSNSLPYGEDIEYKLVWFKRNRIDFLPEGQQKTSQYVFGLECNYSNKNYQQLFWIQEDGTVVINGFK